VLTKHDNYTYISYLQQQQHRCTINQSSPTDATKEARHKHHNSNHGLLSSFMELLLQLLVLILQLIGDTTTPNPGPWGGSAGCGTPILLLRLLLQAPPPMLLSLPSTFGLPTTILKQQALLSLWIPNLLSRHLLPLWPIPLSHQIFHSQPTPREA